MDDIEKKIEELDEIATSFDAPARFCAQGAMDIIKHLQAENMELKLIPRGGIYKTRALQARIDELEGINTQQWRDISEAPKDGTVIYTECGVAVFENSRWYLCDTCGLIPSCADWGREIAEIEPTHWQPLP